MIRKHQPPTRPIVQKRIENFVVSIRTVLISAIFRRFFIEVSLHRSEEMPTITGVRAHENADDHSSEFF